MMYNGLEMNKQSQIISGKWIVCFQPDSFSDQQVLELLLDIQIWLIKKKHDYPGKYITLDKKLEKNSFSMARASIFFKLKNTDISNISENPPEKNIQKKTPLFSRRLKKILLIYPAMRSDRRWESIQIPTPWFFLGSTLHDSHFQVHVQKTMVPFTQSTEEWLFYDALGFTLYEDLYFEISDILHPLRKKFSGLMAAGGPMVTLNPMETAFHFPQINLLVRGEAELVFPELLRAISRNDLNALMKCRGFLFRNHGLMVISDFDQAIQVQDFNNFDFQLDFLKAAQLKNGLEINISRGCNQGCVFCSRVQGRTFRKLPLEKLEQLLIRFSGKLEWKNISTPDSRTININDDDLLQDPEYAGNVLQLIKKHHFRLWGIQTSINSFFNNKGEPDRELIKMASDDSLFANQIPLLWLGTDTFIKKRGKKLGKKIPDNDQMESLIQAFEKNGIQNYHYWISSDHQSDWEEFIEEFLFLMELKIKYKTFHILAHAPFLIPYSATLVYCLLSNNPEIKNQIRYRAILKTTREPFDLMLVERVETRFPCLNRLLKNESMVPPSGFFDYIKKDDFFNALKTIYNFLKQERLSSESSQNHHQSWQFTKLEKIVENRLGKMI